MKTTRDFSKPGRSVAVADQAMAATSHPASTLAAIDILRAGGNAVDAAIAAVAVQSVVDPLMTGIGGDCFVLYSPKGGMPVALNGSGRAPKGATLDSFLDKGMAIIPDLSAHAVTIPGAVDAWCTLSAAHGSMGLDRVLEAAIQYAENGYRVQPRVAHDWAKNQARISWHEPAKAHFLPGGKAPAVGDRIADPALGRTLRRIGKEGRAAFYEGEVADEIATILRGLGATHEVADFAVQTSNFVEPISANYRGYDLHECPPNGQGLTALIIAKILEGFDLPSLSDADRIHLLAEATKTAYRQRDMIVADPDHAPAFDLSEVLSEANIARLRKPIGLTASHDPAEHDAPNHKDTVYVSVVDKDRNAVSFINSVFHPFGSGIYAPKSGVLLQNRGAGFRLIRGHRNAIAPHKRPLHTIIPAMLTKNGRTVMSYGVMGGQYQSTGHAQVLSRVVDFGDNPQAASDHPRSFWFDGVLQLENTISESVKADLEKRGHKVAFSDDPMGGCQAIWIDEARGCLIGGSDHRKDGMALGY